MGELFALAAAFFFFGGSKKSDDASKLPGARAPGGIPEETSCPIRVDVDGRALSICRVGTRFRMYVDHTLDPRTFADLPGVLQRAIVITQPHMARRVTFETAHGTASVFKLDDGSGFDWIYTASDDPTHPMQGATERTMMDALGKLYEVTRPKGFFL